MSNMPKLRFPGFAGVWEEKTLDQLGSFKKGSTLGRQDLSSVGTPCILYGELYTKYGEITTNVESRTVKDYCGLLRSEYGDILIPASGETADDISTSTCLLLSNVIIGSDINLYRSNIIDGRYLSYLLNQKKKNEIARLAQGASVVHIYSAQLKSINIPKPSAAEQTKIADFLTLVDKIITKQDKKVAALEQYKKGLMQKIFAREIRFKDSDGKDYPAWVVHILSNLLEIRDERQTPTSEAPLMAFTSTGGVEDKGDRYNRDFLVKDKNKKYKQTELNDLIYSSNNLDVGAIGRNKYGTAVISDVYEVFMAKENVAPELLEMIIQQKNFLNKVLKYRQGALYGQYRIHADDFLSIEITVPTHPEQIKIANFLTLFDSKIEKEKVKLDALREQKKCLLQQMFV